MIWLWLILSVLFCETINQAWAHKELPPRYWAMEIEQEIKYKADSLLNNWAEEMKKDTL